MIIIVKYETKVLLLPNQNRFLSSYKNIILISNLIRTAFLSCYQKTYFTFCSSQNSCFYFFSFSLDKMVESKNNPKKHKNIGTIIKKTEMLQFVPDHLKSKKMCKTAVKMLSFVIKYIHD